VQASGVQRQPAASSSVQEKKLAHAHTANHKAFLVGMHTSAIPCCVLLVAEVMNRSGPILVEVMTGTYERSRAADKGSYEEAMNGDFLFAPRKIALRRSLSLSRAHICHDNTVKLLHRPARLARPLQSDRKAKPVSFLLFQRRESSSEMQDTLLTTSRQRDPDLSTFSVTGQKRVLVEQLCAATLPRARHRCRRPKGHAPCSRGSFFEQESRKQAEPWEVMKEL
jgi:hypothetical protein